MMHECFIAAGSNLNPEVNIPRALERLESEFDDVVRSPAYRSKAVGGASGKFINLVVRARTGADPETVIDRLKSIERDLGRRPAADEPDRHPIDLDLLIYDDLINDALRLPRDDIERFDFVLKPLADLAPDTRHPRLGTTFAAMWSQRRGAGLTLVSAAELFTA